MGMGPRRPSEVVVSAQTVVTLAKYALVPIRCEAMVAANADGSGAKAPCGQELSCWKSFFKHQIKKHTSKRRSHNGAAYTCRLNKCSALKEHHSSEALKAHVELSHMKSVFLPCPFANCTPHIPDFGRPAKYNLFLKEKDLIGHLHLHHADLIGCELDVRCDKLLPSWEPRPPMRPLRAPPDLPTGIVPTATFRIEALAPRTIRGPGWFFRATESDSAPSSSLAPPSTPLAHTPKTPAGRRRLLRSPAAPSSAPDHAAEPEHDFDDLESLGFDESTGTMHPAALGPPHFVLRRAAERCELVRPLPMGEIPLRERPPPPTSIFHEALRQQVFAQYALGESAAADEPADIP
ncbi:hypothetical protein DFH09DRAFT_1283379 [Mycena vulgaris]|nr:hypothetical protein DFH09DRAFT_1283379 [Mycena vulgaris]